MSRDPSTPAAAPRFRRNLRTVRVGPPRSVRAALLVVPLTIVGYGVWSMPTDASIRCRAGEPASCEVRFGHALRDDESYIFPLGRHDTVEVERRGSGSDTYTVLVVRGHLDDPMHGHAKKIAAPINAWNRSGQPGTLDVDFVPWGSWLGFLVMAGFGLFGAVLFRGRELRYDAERGRVLIYRPGLFPKLVRELAREEIERVVVVKKGSKGDSYGIELWLPGEIFVLLRTTPGRDTKMRAAREIGALLDVPVDF